MLLFVILIIGIGSIELSCHAASDEGSTAILEIVPELNHLQKWNDMHGDTADPFWADDDNLYHFTCDGRGFDILSPSTHSVAP